MAEKKGLLLVSATAVISGVSIFINKFGVSGISPSVFTFSKNLVVALLQLSAVMLWSWKEFMQLRSKDYGVLALIGLVGGSAPFLLFFNGLRLTSAANAAFIHKTMFVWIAVFATLFLKERIHRGFYAGAFLILIGNSLLLKFSVFSIDKGIMLVFAATLLWAAENTLSKHAVKKMPGTIVAFGRMGFGCLFILLYLAATKQISPALILTQHQAVWVLVSSLFLVGYVMTWYNGLKHVDVSKAACVLLLGSPITTLLNALFADMQVTIMQGFGIVFVLAGVISAYGLSNIIRTFIPSRHAGDA